MENDQNLSARYLVFSHLNEDSPYRVVGSAYRPTTKDEYVLYLRILPGVKFYIVPHRDRHGWEYVIFSGRSMQDGKPRYFAKVGSAILIPKKNAIEIHLPDLRQTYYLKLEPKDFHFDAKAALVAA